MMQRVYKAHRCAKAPFRPIKKQRINNSEDSQGDSEASQGDNGESVDTEGDSSSN